jgi:hypothetical protein
VLHEFVHPLVGALSVAGKHVIGRTAEGRLAIPAERSLGELKWPPSACSGMPTLGSGTGSQNGFHIMVRRLTQGLLRLCSGLLTLGSGILTLSPG